MRIATRPLRLSEDSGRASQHGATILEFALGLSLMVLMLGAFFDIGLALHNWLLLRHVTLASAREISAAFVMNPDCTQIKNYLVTRATPQLRNNFGLPVRADQINWHMNWKEAPIAGAAEVTTFPVMQISGNLPVRCFFLCRMFPGGWTLSASNQMVIEVEMPAGGRCDDF